MTPQQAYEKRYGKHWDDASAEVQDLWLASWTIAWSIADQHSTNLIHVLHMAMPFVEDAADDEVYKSHSVHKVLNEIKSTIKKVEQA